MPFYIKLMFYRIDWSWPNATSNYDKPSDSHNSEGLTRISTSVPPLFDLRSFRPWSLSCLPITIPNVYNIKIIHWLKWNYSTILFLCPDKKYLCTNKDIVRIQGYVRNFPMKTLHSQKLQATNDFGIKYWKLTTYRGVDVLFLVMHAVWKSEVTNSMKQS